MSKKILLTAILCFSVFVTFSQSWQKSIDKINEYTRVFDPYYRTFSFNPTTNYITFITSDKDITIKFDINKVNFVKEVNGDKYYLTFKCKDDSKCIGSDYSGDINATAITITNGNVVDELIIELNKIAALAKAPSKSTVVGNSNQSKIDKINEICKKFDPYTRTFSYNEATGILKWVSSGNIVSSAKLKNIRLEVKANTSDFSLRFICLDESKCIECSYGGATNLSSITLNTRESAEEIKSLIESMQGKSTNTTAPSTNQGSRLTNKISNTK